ncbi:hypothetical protein ACYULU_09885 [Breznakiellaceae bacterium SP9]
MKKTTKSRIGGAVAALAVRAAVAKKIVAGAGIAAVGASLVACPNPTEAAYDAAAVRAEVEAWIATAMVTLHITMGDVPNTPLNGIITSNGKTDDVEQVISAGIAAQLPASTIKANIITEVNTIPGLTITAKATINNKSNPLNKKQHIAAANRNAKSVVAASRTRARIG